MNKYENKARKLKMLFLAASFFGLKLLAQVETNYEKNVTSKDIVISCKTNNFYLTVETFEKYTTDKKRLERDLIAVLIDVKKSNLNRSAAACYLGEIGGTNSIESLAGNITLRFEVAHMIEKAWVKADFLEKSTVDALIKIGTPAIPAVIRNLAESDDAQVRELSLKVLNQIEGDKDIVQLRLQKALAAEKDSQKQARLQAALKELVK